MCSKATNWETVKHSHSQDRSSSKVWWHWQATEKNVEFFIFTIVNKTKKKLYQSKNSICEKFKTLNSHHQRPLRVFVFCFCFDSRFHVYNSRRWCLDSVARLVVSLWKIFSGNERYSRIWQNIFNFYLHKSLELIRKHGKSLIHNLLFEVWVFRECLRV